MKVTRFLALLLLIPICAALFSCGSRDMAAVLHTPDDPGYLPTAGTPLDLSPKCPQAFVYDRVSGEILYIKGEDQVIRPASVTKLLTILYALTVLEPDRLVTPGSEVGMISSDSSIAYVRPHHTLSVEMLIEGMLLPSGNDAAYALAGAAGREIAGNPDLSAAEAIGTFMDGMNAFAKDIGCVGSNFTVPDGNDAAEPYTTAEDLILIGDLAAENEIIRKYACLPSDHVTYADGSVNDWVNSDKMVDPESELYHPAVKGLKTGSLDGRYSFLCLAEDGGKSYLIGLFGGKDKDTRFADALDICKTLFDED